LFLLLERDCLNGTGLERHLVVGFTTRLDRSGTPPGADAAADLLRPMNCTRSATTSTTLRF